MSGLTTAENLLEFMGDLLKLPSGTIYSLRHRGKPLRWGCTLDQHGIGKDSILTVIIGGLAGGSRVSTVLFSLVIIYSFKIICITNFNFKWLYLNFFIGE